ncbi:WPP domain-interacting protein 2-like [Pyrus communis]|uniref:WPP domain-interacting protein 2-like n=1 Tax=Pyrus communis TaxID=23211 RepID=UPI0035BF5610
MDLENESVEDVAVNPQAVSDSAAADGDDGSSNSIRNNGSCGNEIGNVADSRVNDGGTEQAVNLSHPAAKSPVGGSPPTVKGRGLRKWKRIKRNFAKDDNDNAVDDSSKVLKRGLSGNGNPVKPKNWPIEIRHNNSDVSVGSVNMLRNVGVADSFAIPGSSSDSRFAVGSAFAAVADSENSSSKSSTAASVPKAKFELPAAFGHAWDKNKMKSTSGRSVSNSAQKAQQGKTQAESSKKHRGDRGTVEKENSYSSMESDSRSSNFVFMQSPILSSNGKQSGRSMSHDGEDSDEVHASEPQYSEEAQTGYSKENVGDVEDFSQGDFLTDLPWMAKVGKNKNHRSLTDQDPLVESILNLQSVQEALAKEVQKFGEIGKETLSADSNGGGIPADIYSSDSGINESNLSDHFGFDKIGQSSSKSMESQVLSLKQNVKLLESKLDETRAILEVKESRVAELEDMINVSKSAKEDSGSTVGLEEEKSRELEAELDGVFRQVIEAQVEFIAIKSSTQRLKLAAGGQIALLDEQEALAGEQAQMLNKLGEVEIRAAKLKKRTMELGILSGDILETEEVFSIQKRFCKITSCLFIQLILLGLAIFLFLSQSSHQGVAVPT